MKDTHTSGEPLYTHPMRWAKAWMKFTPPHLHKSLAAVADSFDRGAGYVYHTQARIAEEWCIPERTFRRHLADLERLGAIDREPYTRKAGPRAGTRGADRIRLLPDPATVERTTTGHDGGRLSDGQPATAMAGTTGHDGGRAKFSSGVPSTQGVSHPLDTLGADAPHAQPPPVAELETAADGDDDDMRIPAGECLLCHQRRRHADWCTAQMRHDYVHDDVPF